MDIETKMDLIKQVGEEIVTEKELKELFQTKDHPIAYDGFEPSGIAGIHFGLFRAINIEDMIKAGIHFKLWIADSFGWINNKMSGDLEKIQMTGKYFVEVWKASGIDLSKVEVLWATDAFKDSEYWKKVILIAKNTTVKRSLRCLTIMGRKEGEMRETAQFFYPMMQTADIFHLKADICQLGLDQRRANMLAREVGPKLGWWKPVVVSHHMLMGLQGIKTPEGYDENSGFDVQISSKMSKSKPETCIYVHDSKEEIERKINNAFCPEKVIENNPILEYSKQIIFRKFDTIKVQRSEKFGGNIEFESYTQLENEFRQGNLHPLDLKKSVAEHMEILVKPIREHFEKDKKAKELYEVVKSQKITR